MNRPYTREEKATVVSKGEARLGREHFIGHGIQELHLEDCGVIGCMKCFNIKLDRLVESSEAALRPALVTQEIEWQG